MSPRAGAGTAVSAWVRQVRQVLDPGAGGAPVRDPSGQAVRQLLGRLPPAQLPEAPRNDLLNRLHQLLWALGQQGALQRGRLAGRGTYLLALQDPEHPVWQHPERVFWGRRHWQLARETWAPAQLQDLVHRALAQGPVRAPDGLALFDLAQRLGMRQPVDPLWHLLLELRHQGAVQLELSTRVLGGRGAPPGLLGIQLLDPRHPAWSRPPSWAPRSATRAPDPRQRLLQTLQQGPIGDCPERARATRELAQRAGFPVGSGTMYGALARLVDQGLVLRCTDQVGRAWRWQLVGLQREGCWWPAPLHQRVLVRLQQGALGPSLDQDVLLGWLARDVGGAPPQLQQALQRLVQGGQARLQRRGRYLFWVATDQSGAPSCSPGVQDPAQDPVAPGPGPGDPEASPGVPLPPGAGRGIPLQQAAQRLGWSVPQVRAALARGQLLADPEDGGVLPESLDAEVCRLQREASGRPDPQLVVLAQLAWWDWPPGSPQAQLLLGLLRGQSLAALQQQWGAPPGQLQDLLAQVARRAGLAGLPLGSPDPPEDRSWPRGA